MMITSKGQITIPKEIRNISGLLPHTEAEIVFVNGEVKIRSSGENRHADHGARIVAALRGKGDVNLSTDEIMAMTRGQD